MVDNTQDNTAPREEFSGRFSTKQGRRAQQQQQQQWWFWKISRSRCFCPMHRSVFSTLPEGKKNQLGNSSEGLCKWCTHGFYRSLRTCARDTDKPGTGKGIYLPEVSANYLTYHMIRCVEKNRTTTDCREKNLVEASPVRTASAVRKTFAALTW